MGPGGASHVDLEYCRTVPQAPAEHTHCCICVRASFDRNCKPYFMVIDQARSKPVALEAFFSSGPKVFGLITDKLYNYLFLFIFNNLCKCRKT